MLEDKAHEKSVDFENVQKIQDTNHLTVWKQLAEQRGYSLLDATKRLEALESELKAERAKRDSCLMAFAEMITGIMNAPLSEVVDTYKKYVKYSESELTRYRSLMENTLPWIDAVIDSADRYTRIGAKKVKAEFEALLNPRGDKE